MIWNMKNSRNQLGDFFYKLWRSWSVQQDESKCVCVLLFKLLFSFVPDIWKYNCSKQHVDALLPISLKDNLRILFSICFKSTSFLYWSEQTHVILILIWTNARHFYTDLNKSTSFLYWSEQKHVILILIWTKAIILILIWTKAIILILIWIKVRHSYTDLNKSTSFLYWSEQMHVILILI